MRCSLRVSPRLPVQIEICIPESSTGAGLSPCVIGETGASRIFQILYRNEEITLRDVVVFRVHLLGKQASLIRPFTEYNLINRIIIFSSFIVDSRHLKESIERAEFSLNLELWFGEQTTGSNLTLASTRILQLNFHPVRGLHYHLPVLFDYFHLSAVTLGIHASLITLHQPYIK